MTCPRCAALEKQVEHERARVDKYADLLFRVKAQEAGVPATVDPGQPIEAPVEFPKAVMQAILERSEPNSPTRRDLMTRAREMMDAGVGAGDIAERITKGDEVDV